MLHDVLYKIVLERLLNEKRRSDSNGVRPETDSDILSKYVGKGCFVHYSDLNKLGINTRSKFETPLGIYGYPITEKTVKIASGESDEECTFATDRKYAHVFRPRNPSKVVYLDTIAIDDVLDIVNRMNAVTGSQTLSKDKFEELTSEIHDKSPGGKLWYWSIMATQNQMRKLHRSATFTWNLIWRKVGVDGVVDSGAGIIHSNEPWQGVFFDASVIEHVDTIVSPRFKQKITDAKRDMTYDKILFNVVLSATNDGAKTLSDVQDWIKKHDVKVPERTSTFQSTLVSLSHNAINANNYRNILDKIQKGWNAEQYVQNYYPQTYKNSKININKDDHELLYKEPKEI